MSPKQSLLVIVVLSTCFALPVNAESAKSFAGNLPQRIASFAAGAAIGTPIALVRCTKREVVKQTKVAFNLGGVRPKPLGYFSAAFFGIPSGIMSGAICGLSDGVLDSVRGAKDEPFGKESFSLDKLTFDLG